MSEQQEQQPDYQQLLESLQLRVAANRQQLIRRTQVRQASQQRKRSMRPAD